MLTRSTAQSLNLFLLLALVLSLGYSLALSQDDAPPAVPADDNAPEAAPEETPASPDETPEPETVVPGERPWQVAFVNMEEAIQHYPVWLSELERLTTRAREHRQELQEMKRAVEELERQVRETPRADLIDELYRRRYALESRQRQMERELQSDTIAVSREVYEAVYREIESYSDEAGFDLVLNVMRRDIVIGNRDEFNAKVVLRSVVMYPEALDITDAIIERLGGETEEDEGTDTETDSPDGDGEETPETPSSE